MSIQGSYVDDVYQYLELNFINKQKATSNDIKQALENDYYKHDIKLQLFYLEQSMDMRNMTDPIQLNTQDTSYFSINFSFISVTLLFLLLK